MFDATGTRASAGTGRRMFHGKRCEPNPALHHKISARHRSRPWLSTYRPMPLMTCGRDSLRVRQGGTAASV